MHFLSEGEFREERTNFCITKPNNLSSQSHFQIPEMVKISGSDFIPRPVVDLVSNSDLSVRKQQYNSMYCKYCMETAWNRILQYNPNY